MDLEEKNKLLLEENLLLKAKVEELQEKVDCKEKLRLDFLANVSHELRTPLNSIIGFTEVLLDRYFGEINKRQEKYLYNILSSGRYLLDIINSVLELAKIEAGRLELRLDKIYIDSLIEVVQRTITPALYNKKQTLELDLDDKIGLVDGDELRLKQVLLNLVNNAIKFTHEEGVIKIESKNLGDSYSVAVIDNGIGIKQEDLGIIFEEFRQIECSINRRYEGTGLGLAITKELINLHHGKIWVESEFGKGSKFIFVIPKSLIGKKNEELAAKE